MTHHRQTESDTHRLTSEVKRMLNETIMHLREDVRATDQPKAQALFETTAEVLNGLVTAYDHFEARAEEARLDSLERQIGLFDIVDHSS